MQLFPQMMGWNLNSLLMSSNQCFHGKEKETRMLEIHRNPKKKINLS